MGNYKYTFFDNQLIGVDDLNKITSRLVSGGISAAYSGADFTVSDINNSNSAMLTGGVVPESDSNLKIVSLGGGRYLINQGVCFFDDGTSMEILSGGEEIFIPEGQAGYVYLVSDKNQMMCYVEITDSKKQTGVFQMLGFVDQMGLISDRRTYARGKVPNLYSSTEGKTVNLTCTYTSDDINGAENIEIPVGEGNFAHLCIETKDGSGTLFYCEFKNGEAVNQSEETEFSMFYDYNKGNIRANANIKMQNGKLIIPINTKSIINSGKNATISYHLW